MWTHSTFGFESKYGYLKKFFHGKNSIHQQLIFNNDALVTLQYLRAHIFEQDVRASMLFDYVSHKKIRSNMICISEHCYQVGQSVMMMLTTEQSSALNCEINPCECFFQLFKNGEMFHSTSYKEGKSFRNDTVCFIQQNNSLLCGEITVFVMKPVPLALINVLHP